MIFPIETRKMRPGDGAQPWLTPKGPTPQPQQPQVHFDTWGAEHDEWISRDSQVGGVVAVALVAML